MVRIPCNPYMAQVNLVTTQLGLNTCSQYTRLFNLIHIIQGITYNVKISRRHGYIVPDKVCRKLKYNELLFYIQSFITKLNLLQY